MLHPKWQICKGLPPFGVLTVSIDQWKSWVSRAPSKVSRVLLALLCLSRTGYIGFLPFPFVDFSSKGFFDHQKDLKAPVTQPLWVLCRGLTKSWSFQGSQWYQLNREILSIWTRLQGWFLGGTLWEPDQEGSRWRIQGRNLDKRPNVIWKLHLCFYLYSSNYLRPVVLRLEYVSESPGGLLKLLLGPPSEFLIP